MRLTFSKAGAQEQCGGGQRARPCQQCLLEFGWLPFLVQEQYGRATPTGTSGPCSRTRRPPPAHASAGLPQSGAAQHQAPGCMPPSACSGAAAPHPAVSPLATSRPANAQGLAPSPQRRCARSGSDPQAPLRRAAHHIEGRRCPQGCSRQRSWAPRLAAPPRPCPAGMRLGGSGGAPALGVACVDPRCCMALRTAKSVCMHGTTSEEGNERQTI